MAVEFNKKYETLTVEVVKENIAHIQLNRPKKLNSITFKCFEELADVFRTINEYPFRAAVLSGAGKHFTAGLDLNDAASLSANEEKDAARQSLDARKNIFKAQDSTLAIVDCRVPVICAISGYCIGAGIDLACACDIRVAEENTKFCVAEVDIGMAADVGTLQRLPFIVGNESWAREICYTGRVFGGLEAQK